MKRLISLLSAFFILSVLCAQDFSNKGKDFWLGYGYHVRYVTSGGGPNNGQEMVLYFATENIPGRFTNIRIEIPGVGYVQTINNVAPGTIATSAPIPKSGAQDARLPSEGTYNRGIHITSDRPVVAYAHIYNSSVSGATLLFPTNTLGKEYYSMNFTQSSNEDFSNSFFFVVATDTGQTTVEITPAAATQGHAANVPFTVTLNQGEIYNVMGQLLGGSPGDYNGVDLSGSRIRSVNANGVGCKRIAVFSGAGKMKIDCPGGGNNGASSDNLIAQAFPRSAWGKKFLTVPTQNMPNNYFRIGVSNPGAVVRVNGNPVAGLTNGFYYQLPLTNQPLLIESDEPIMVSQYITTRNTCGNNFMLNDGDPEMIYLSPVEQTIDEVILNSTPNFSITQHWINVVMKTNAVSSFSITGAVGAYNFNLHPADPNYSYAQIRVTPGAHTLRADSGFNAIAYGYGNAETYGYNAGTNLKDLYNFVEPLNPLNISGTNSACACTPFYFTITYPYQPLSLFWDFKGFQTPNVTVNNPVADTTYFINGKQVWRYKLPNPNNYCPAGNYPLSVTAGTAGTDGCGNFQTKEDTLYVRNTPNPDFDWLFNGCVSDSVRFSDLSSYDDGVYSYQWFWDFGDGNTSTERNPVHKYNAPGDYRVRFNLVTNIGCISTTRNKIITVTEVPVARFGVTEPVCMGKDALFTDSSSIAAPGVLQTRYWDFGDGSRDTVINSNDPLPHTYLLPGVRTATLVVATPSGCRSLPASRSFTIFSNPTVNFDLPSRVCLPYETAAFTDRSSIEDGTAAGFRFLWSFGEPQSGSADSAALPNPQHLYSGTGPFQVTLRVTSVAGCVDSLTRELNTVYARPLSSINVSPEFCLNTVSAFSSNASGNGNALSAWFWNFGDGSTGNGATVSHTYALADTFTVRHWVSTEQGCTSDTTAVPVIIHPLPQAAFDISSPFCEKNALTFTDRSTVGTGSLSQWIWNFGTGGPDSLLNSAQPFTFRYDTTGSYTISLRLVSDKGCSTAVAFNRTIAVNPLPKPGFISPEVCLTDASAQFRDTSSIASGTLSAWSWNFGDPASGGANRSGLQNPQHRYNAIGLYTAVLTVTSAAGCSDSVRQSFTVNGDIPDAYFGFPAGQRYCSNDSVSIADSSSVNFGNITRVEICWDFQNAPAVIEADELPFRGKIYRHKYPEFQQPLTRDYTIRYKAYSGASCVDIIDRRITLQAAPLLQFAVIPPVCPEAPSFTVTQATETGGVPGTGVYSGSGINAAGIFLPGVTGAGSFPLFYTYTSTAGCVDTASGSITVLQPATDSFSFSQPTCARNSIRFTDQSTIPAASGTIVNRSWNFADGTAVVNQPVAQPLDHVFATANTYPVTLTLLTSNGCTYQFRQPVTVHPLPVPGFRIPASACLPDASITFTDTSSIDDGTGNSFTYLWNFDDPASGAANTSRSKNPTHVFTEDRVYQIRLTVTSGNQCTDSTVIPLNTLHPQPVAALRSDSASLCENQSVRFSDASSGGDGVINQWQWDFGNGNTSSLQFPPAQTYTSARVYPIVLEVTDSYGCKDTLTQPFTVYANPVISAGPDRVLLEGGEITLQATASGSGLSYNWSPASYLSGSRLLNPVVKGIPGDIVYTLQVVAAGGCWVTDEVLVKLLKAPVIPNTFSPNGDGINDFWTIQYLDSYPDCRIQIFSRSGQLVFESSGYLPPGWDGRYKGRQLPFGTYYYVIEPGSGRQPITGYVTLLY